MNKEFKILGLLKPLNISKNFNRFFFESKCANSDMLDLEQIKKFVFDIINVSIRESLPKLNL